MLKFVQNNKEFAQKLTTPIWWGNQILFLISKKFYYFQIVKKGSVDFGMDIAIYFT
jgi:hypothetical protein